MYALILLFCIFKKIFIKKYTLDQRELSHVKSNFLDESGYRSPEASIWNEYKEAQKRKRKRKLEGTCYKVNQMSPASLRRYEINKWKLTCRLSNHYFKTFLFFRKCLLQLLIC